jgi:hypothetical protein
MAKVAKIQFELVDGSIVTGKVQECAFTRRNTIAPIYDDFVAGMARDWCRWDILAQMSDLKMTPGRPEEILPIPGTTPELQALRKRAIQAVKDGDLEYALAEGLLRKAAELSAEDIERAIDKLREARAAARALLEGKVAEKRQQGLIDSRRFRSLEED